MQVAYILLAKASGLVQVAQAGVICKWHIYNWLRQVASNNCLWQVSLASGFGSYLCNWHTSASCIRYRQVAREYASLFAEHNLDLGRTEVVKYQINTRDNRPIKQQQRKIPVHLTEEVSKNKDDMLVKDVI